MHQFRQAYDYDRTEFGQFSRVAAGPRDPARGRALRPDRARRGEADLRDLAATSPSGSQRYTGLDAEVLPPPPQKLAYRTDGYERLRPLGQPARPRQADRPADRGGEARPVAADRDRRRRAPTAARLEQLASGLERAGRVHRPRRRRAARRPLRALPRRLLRAGRRGLRDGPVRGVPVREARGDDDATRAGRSRSSATGETGSSSRPSRPRSRRRAPISRRTSTRRRPGARRARPSPSASPGTPASTPCSREGRLLLADAAVAVRDRRLLGAAAAGAARAGRRGRRRRAGQARARAPTSRSTTSATTPTRTAGSSTRCGERPGVVVLHEFVLHHLIAGITIGRGDGRGYLDAMERELGVAGRLLGLGVLDNLLPLLWETQPERFPLTGTVLDLADGPDRPLALRRGGVRARPATTGRSGGSRTRPGPPEHVEPGRRRRATRSSAASAT